MKQLGAWQENKGTHWVRGQSWQEEMHGEKNSTELPLQPHGSLLVPAGRWQADGKELGLCLLTKREQGSKQLVREQRGARAQDDLRS